MAYNVEHRHAGDIGGGRDGAFCVGPPPRPRCVLPGVWFTLGVYIPNGFVSEGGVRCSRVGAALGP